LFSPLREENRLWVFWDKLLTNIFGLQRGEATEGWWRELCNNELQYLYFPPNIIGIMKSGRINSSEHIPRIGEVKNIYKILAPEKLKACEKPRTRWQPDIQLCTEDNAMKICAELISRGWILSITK
jgi:hypothetical protein